MLDPQKLTPEQSLNRAAGEVEKVMTAYSRPQEELFTRYLNKTEAEREAFVLALIAQASVTRARGRFV